MWEEPSVSEFKDFFERDFNFAPSTDPDNLEYVTDKDITRAINEALINFNTELFGDDDQITNVFMYLAAYHLVRNITNSAKGLSSQSKFPISSNNVGSVSVSFQIPDKYSKDPYLNSFTQNGYGMRYLELTLPYLVGNVTVADGGFSW